MSRTRALFYGLIITVCFPIAIASAFNVMADRPRVAGAIVAACYVAAFVTGLIVMATKLREGGAKMSQAGAQRQEIHAFYRSMLWPTVWTVFRAALIAGTMLSPLALLIF